MTPRISEKSYPRSRAMLTSARESFGKQLPPQPGPGLRNWGPIRPSLPMPATTAATSAPTCSHIAATLLMNEIFIARNPLAAYLIVSAEAGSVRMIWVSSDS